MKTRTPFRGQIRFHRLAPMAILLAIWVSNPVVTAEEPAVTALPSSTADVSTGIPASPLAYRSDRLLLLPGANRSALERLHERFGTVVLSSYPAMGHLQVLSVPTGIDPRALVTQYEKSGQVVWVEPDYWVQATALPNDPMFTNGTQWNLHNQGQNGGLADADIDAPEAWDIRTSASNVVVAVIDSGIWQTHEELRDNLWINPGEVPGNGVDDDANGYVDDVNGANAVSRDGTIRDVAGHGTHAAGIIGAAANNGKGVAGIAWQVRLMACRFLASNGSGSISDALACIDYARMMGAQVINASWGATNFSAALEEAVASAGRAGIVFVAAAGNDGRNNDRAPFYPASLALDNVISVLGTTSRDARLSFSNYGEDSVDLGAPGLNITSAFFISDENYVGMSGSSQAAAHVSGAAALVRAQFPAAGPTEVIGRLLWSSDPAPALRGLCRTGARLNLARALEPGATLLWPRPQPAIVASAGYVPAAAAPRWVFSHFGTQTLAWETRMSADWLALAPTNGLLNAGASVEVGGNWDARVQALPPGRHTNVVRWLGEGEVELARADLVLELYAPARLALILSVGPTWSLRLEGEPGASYAFEASANLGTWTRMQTNVTDELGATALDFAPPGVARYYRAVRLGSDLKF